MNLYDRNEIKNSCSLYINKPDYMQGCNIKFSNKKDILNYEYELGFKKIDPNSDMFILNGYYLYKDSLAILRGYYPDNITALIIRDGDLNYRELSIKFVDIPISNFEYEATQLYNKLQKLLIFQ